MPILIAILLSFLTLKSAQPVLNLKPTTYYIQPTSIPTPKPTPPPPMVAPPDNKPWGVAQKTGEHTYEIKVQNDASMGTPDEILSALNALRSRYGAQPLKKDTRLCSYTQSRADLFARLGETDAHSGFSDFLENQDGFIKLGFGSVGENSSYGYIMSGVHLIEFVYMQSPEHNANQLNPDWDHGCVGVSGVATNLLFATSPL